MKKIALGLLLSLTALTLQADPLRMYFVKIPYRQMAAAGFPASGPDVLQVWTSTDSSDTKAFRISVRYSWQDKTYSDAQTVDRNSVYYSGAIFRIPDVSVKILSVVIEELKSANSQEFPGE
ncbi:MAG: hypothetical protein M3O35_18645 [Acidobacteriota bacterium]|nr:hypothetical protein [Acidobacteriota bacterium]